MAGEVKQFIDDFGKIIHVVGRNLCFLSVQMGNPRLSKIRTGFNLRSTIPTTSMCMNHIKDAVVVGGFTCRREEGM